MEGPSPERLLLAIAVEKVGVFRLEGGRGAESAVANGGLLTSGVIYGLNKEEGIG